jgi:hypothetical protein
MFRGIDSEPHLTMTSQLPLQAGSGLQQMDEGVPLSRFRDRCRSAVYLSPFEGDLERSQSLA